MNINVLLYIFFFFIIQCVKACAIPYLHQPPTRVITVSVAALSPWLAAEYMNINILLYIYIYIYIHTHIYIYIYSNINILLYIERKKN